MILLMMSALHDDKSVKQVNLRLAAGKITAAEAQHEIFAEHVAILPFGTSDSQVLTDCNMDPD